MRAQSKSSKKKKFFTGACVVCACVYVCVCPCTCVCAWGSGWVEAGGERVDERMAGEGPQEGAGSICLGGWLPWPSWTADRGL